MLTVPSTSLPFPPLYHSLFPLNCFRPFPIIADLAFRALEIRRLATSLPCCDEAAQSGTRRLPRLGTVPLEANGHQLYEISEAED